MRATKTLEVNPLEFFLPCVEENIVCKVREMVNEAKVKLIRPDSVTEHVVAEGGTVGCSVNINEASWQALVDSVEYKLQKEAACNSERMSRSPEQSEGVESNF